ncbi:MAG: AAA family ATPase, partial [Gammaproteobacteria bacterium]|nr:AAA family ATPase [Gammaproteobacteria bacterium]
DAVSDSLLRIVGCFTPQNALAPDEDSAYANEEADILLSKPANAAQLSILRRLSKRDGVLVQGPPGTGKTHTIANLIGSLLADGKTVLVTSHTTKALRVLRQQVADPLRDLCVSVLDSDLAGKKDLESAVRSLANRLDDDLSRLRRDAVDSTQRRQQLIQDLRKNRDDLEMAVNGEYRSLVLDGEEIEPVKAAKEVANGVDQHDWLPGPVNAGPPLPLSIAEIHALYAGTAAIPQADEPELAHTLPDLAQLWSPERFEAQVKEFTTLNTSLLAFRRDLWNSSNPNGDLEAMLTRMREGLEMLTRSEQEPWRLAAIEAGMAGDAARRLWTMACEDIETVQRQAEAAAALCYRHTPQPPENGDLDMWLAIVEEIIAFLAQGKTLSSFKLLLNPRWKLFIASSTVEGGAQPGRLEHFQALQVELRLRQSRAGLILRWKQHLEPLGLPSLTEAPDTLQFAAQHVPGIHASLDWHSEHWHPIEKELQAHGLDWPRLLGEAPPSTSQHHRAERLRDTVLHTLLMVIEAERTRRRQARLLAELAEYEQALSHYRGVGTVRLLGDAVKLRNIDTYRQRHVRLEYLLKLQPPWQERQERLKKIRAVAPEWAHAIQARQSPHDQPNPPGDALAAWRWRQFSEELDRRAALSIPALQNSIERLSKELMDTTTSLVESKAWVALIERVNHNQQARQALLGWVKTTQKIGAGTGKNVEALRRQAQREMSKARGAVPVWIMPFSRITENFHPVRDRFDVLIVDEASQEDVVGLAPFYLADKVIVVGDDEQVTPLDVGGAIQPIQDLIGQWLQGLPSPLLFDLKTSIYDRAQIAFDASIRLKEHFRCVPEIIQFSNHLSYGGE